MGRQPKKAKAGNGKSTVKTSAGTNARTTGRTNGKTNGKKRLNLALQGGGSHGAYA